MATENTLELVIKTDLAPGTGLPKEIMFNYDELKSQLTGYVAKFDGLVVDENAVAEARRIRADINKVIKQLTAAGTETKAKWNRPLDTFLNRVKELVGIAKPVEAKIADQIKAHDAKLRTERKAALEKFLMEQVARHTAEVTLGGVPEFKALPQDEAEAFSKSKHWAGCITDEMLNASASVSKAKDALSKEVRRCRSAVETVRRMYAQGGQGWPAKAIYLLARWDFDEQTTSREADRQLEDERKAAERAKREAEEAAAVQPTAEEIAKHRLAERRAAQSAAPAAQPAPVPAPVQAPAPAPAATASAVEAAAEVMSYTLRITGPKAKLFELRNWLVANGLSFERA